MQTSIKKKPHSIGFIFDLDGTLVDTEGLYKKSLFSLLKKYNLEPPSEEKYGTYTGFSNDVYIEELFNYKSTKKILKQELLEEIEKNMTKDGISAIPGIFEILQLLAPQKNIALFIASTSSKEWIKKCLEVKHVFNNTFISYRSFFNENYISCEEVPRPKPYPDVFIEAHKHMGQPNNIYIVGDSISDVEAGIAAKMKVFFISNTVDTYKEHKDVITCSNALFLFKEIEKLFIS